MPLAAFAKDEKVLAFHGPLIHEAQVQEMVEKVAPDNKTKVNLYLLRYEGFTDHWDEWVPESRVLRDTQDNRARQKERIKEFHRAHKRKREAANGAASGNGGASASGNGKAKAAKTASSGSADGSEETSESALREQLRLPHAAKLKLIEDWERITREKKLVPLPASTSIATLLDEFLTQKAKRTTSHERLYSEVSEGVKAYFEQALPTILLYKYEKKQWRDLKEQRKGEPVTAYYGAEHLLRLFVKLPELLSRCNMQKEHMTVLVTKLGELIRFAMSQKSKYFAADYETPEAEYLQWWARETTKEA